MGARSHGRDYNAAAIPDALAEEVADEVAARFQEMRIRKQPPVTITDADKEDFNSRMAIGNES